MALPISPPIASILSAFIADNLGIQYAAADAALLADKISPRAIEKGFTSLLDYYYLLRYDDPTGEELTALAEALVVNETYFFREVEPLRVLVNEVIAPRVAEKGSARVWSAACATGEEPLSLAMLLAQREILEHVSIVASDLSMRVLEKARKGTYRARSVRAVLPAAATRYLHLEGDQYVVDPALVSRISWRKLNLLDDAAIVALGEFDAILCRNVLIYFSEETGSHVLKSLHGALVKNGVLLLGVSESALRFGASFHCEERGGAFLYRKAS